VFQNEKSFLDFG